MCNTKSFILHTDTLAVLDEMTDAQAGKLFKAIKEYQLSSAERCEQDVESDTDSPLKDFVIRIAFAPFRAQFERDAEKYEKIVSSRRVAGKKGRAEQTKRANAIKNEQNEQMLNKTSKTGYSDSDSDSDSDLKNINDITDVGDNVNTSPKPQKPKREKSCAKKEKVDFRAKLVEIGVSEQIAIDWLEVRRTKKATNTATALNRILAQLRLAYKAGYTPEDCIRTAVEKDWKGFEYKWLENLKNDSNDTATTDRGNNNPQPKQPAGDRAQGYADGLVAILSADDTASSGLVPRL